MFRKTTFGGAVLAAAAGLAAGALTPIAAHAAQPSGKIVIDVVTANGTGCPRGTTAVAMSPDNTAFTVTYSAFIAQVGGPVRPTDFRKNCQLDLNVHVPNGLTFAVIQVDYRGFGHLERGARGLEQANYYFQGQSQTQRVGHPFVGPMDRDWQATDLAALAARVYRPCGEERNLNVNTELRVSAGWSDPSRTSFLTMDSTDTAISTVYHLAWRRCPVH